MTMSVHRLILLTVAVAVMTSVFTSAPAHAQMDGPTPVPMTDRGLPDFLSRWFPQWFGAEETGPRPEDTLQAPFVDPEAVKREKAEEEALERSGVIYRSSDGNKYRSITGENNKTFQIPAYDPATIAIEGGSLDKPHRRPEHLAEWLTRAASEIMTTDNQGYEAHLKHLSTGMSEAALIEYQKFMDDSKIMNELRTVDVKLIGYVEEPPLLLNEGPLNGRYRWLFEMPVTITLMPRNAQNYRDVKDPEENTLRFIVQTQVGRVEKGPSEDNVFIETWRVRAAEPAKKKPAAP